MDMDNWELSKENIQPLRGGRVISMTDQQLDEKKINEQKEAFELALRSYDGPDPLEPWYNYITWIEQTFVKGGKEGNLQEMVEKCIKRFKDDPVLNQDERFMQVWIKYATRFSTTPIDIYKYIYSQNMCTSRPNLYYNWAWELELVGNFKLANKVFALGLSTVTDEAGLTFLDAKHKQFQARVCQKILHRDEDDKETESVVDSRTVLASLEGQGKRQTVGSIRIGAAKKSEGPGVLSSIKPLPSASNSKVINVFCDGAGASADALPVKASAAAPLPFQRGKDQENDLQPGKWTEAKVGKKSQAVPLNKISTRPTFAIFEDETSEAPTDGTRSSSTSSNRSLKVRKSTDEQHDVPLALFEPPDPMFKPMYCKHMVYQGATEFSFEELRAIKYNRIRAERETAEIQKENERRRQEYEKEHQRIEAERLKLERARLELERQRIEDQRKFFEDIERKKDEFEKWMAAQKRQLLKTGSDCQQKDDTPLPEKVSSMSSLDDTKALLLQKTVVSDSSDRPPSQQQQLSSASPTINTKWAQQIWFTQDESADQSSMQAQPQPPAENKPPFSIFRDDEPTANSSSQPQPHEAPVEAKPPFPIFCDNEPAAKSSPEFVKPAAPTSSKVPFTIYCDENVNPATKSKLRLRIQDDEEEVESQKKLPTPTLVHNDENATPLYSNMTFDDAYTIKLPSKEAFEQMARMSSTPFHGRQFIPEVDDAETCNIQIITAKAINSNNRVNHPDPPAAAVVGHQFVAMSPIMESSRENFISSSSSSSNASSVAHMTKTPHFGRTQMATSNTTTTTGRTPASGLLSFKMLESTTPMSGYMADNSSSHQVAGHQTRGTNKPFPQGSIKLPSHGEEEEDDDLNGDLLAEFQKNAGLVAKSSSHQAVGVSSVSATPKVTINETLDDVTLPLSSRKLEKSSFQGRNLKSGASFLSESLKMSFLAPEVDISSGQPKDFSCSEMKMPECPSPSLDASGLQPPIMEVSEMNSPTMVSPSQNATYNFSHLAEPAAIVDETLNKSLDLSNPFNVDLHLHLLSKLQRPVNLRHGYKRVPGHLPQIKINSSIDVADVQFQIMSSVGEGGFGKVFKALKISGDSNTTIANIDVVLKLQKPAREWEFYICTELHDRLLKSGSAKDCRWFMSIPRCYTYDDGSIFVSEHLSTGTLLDICNKVSLMRSADIEPIAVYFTIEMLRIAEALRKAQIIHADIKPENFLIQRWPSIRASAGKAMFDDWLPSLQLIDFGLSIDMALLPEGTTFTQSFEKAANKSTEMMEGKPWTYQLDCFGIAGVSYILLHGAYMKLNKINGRYVPAGSYKRWWNNELWTKYFDDFLNIPSCTQLPDMLETRHRFENFFIERYAEKFAGVAFNLQ